MTLVSGKAVGCPKQTPGVTPQSTSPWQQRSKDRTVIPGQLSQVEPQPFVYIWRRAHDGTMKPALHKLTRGEADQVETIRPEDFQFAR